MEKGGSAIGGGVLEQSLVRSGGVPRHLSGHKHQEPPVSAPDLRQDTMPCGAGYCVKGGQAKFSARTGRVD